VHSRVLEITTGEGEVVVDLTSRCEDFLADVDAGDGLLHVFVPHATAGVAVIETGAGSDRDVLDALDVLLPRSGPHEHGWRHRHGSTGHGRDHVVPAILAPFAVLPVLRGRLALGTWQSITVVDTNGDNRQRSVRLSFLPG